MTRVLASRYAVVTQAMCDTPPRSPTMVGIAVETIVWSRLDTSIPASSAAKMTLMRRRVRTSGGAAAGALGMGLRKMRAGVTGRGGGWVALGGRRGGLAGWIFGGVVSGAVFGAVREARRRGGPTP